MLLAPSFRQLPERFYSLDAIAPLPNASMGILNRRLVTDLQADADAVGATLLGLVGAQGYTSDLEPIATGYAGHQFGSFVPTLGDGRAHLVGELGDPAQRRWDVQFKGSGRTIYSRGGDGRATLGSVLREYLMGECLHALGIPTTRALAVLQTGEAVQRETAKPGAILARIAASHLRVGSFQYYACRGDQEGLQLLADYAIARHDPDLTGAPDRYRRFLERVVERQARLIAQWMSVGFIHGVMNTDNMTISGETLDYGPCAFLDHMDPRKVFSSIDRGGRYAYGNQPNIGLWNLARLAETLLPLLAEDEDAAIEQAEAVLTGYATAYEAAYTLRFAHKLGLTDVEASDRALVADLLDLMTADRVDFTVFFRQLSDCPLGDKAVARATAHFTNAEGFATWLIRWRARLETTGCSAESIAAAMRAVNPAYIARNHRVEEAIAAAETEGDLQPAEKLVEWVSKPYDDRPGGERYQTGPEPHEVVRQTFCGT